MASALEETMDVLNKVRKTDLDNNVNEYFRFERMYQRWNTQGGASDKLYPFFRKLDTSCKRVYESARKYFNTIENEAGDKNIKHTDEYREYSELVGAMVDLAGVYDFFNEGSGPFSETDVSKMKSLVAQAVSGYPLLEKTVWDAIDRYINEANEYNKKQLLSILIKAIKNMADITNGYMDTIHQKGSSELYNKYRKVYLDLSKIGTGKFKWLTSNSSQAETLDMDIALLKLDNLKNIALEDEKNDSAKQCAYLAEQVSKIRYSKK